uniref:39S ribosomal protein L41, mitochondrial n=1 Tax=Heterorhabditis bacteriophora TaxID=37862 RepID=A0A1I7XJX6_HETBA
MFSVFFSTSLDIYSHVPRKIYIRPPLGVKKMSLNVPAEPYRVNDYLHPKYSLPPVKIDIVEKKWEFEQLLRTPGRAPRTSHSPSPKQSLTTDQIRQMEV